MPASVHFYPGLLQFKLESHSSFYAEELFHRALLLGVDAKPRTVAPYGIRQLHFRDPDGYGICFELPA